MLLIMDDTIRTHGEEEEEEEGCVCVWGGGMLRVTSPGCDT